ncbi:hypothetical protein ACFFSW_17520 [Saccharothrix longispora]|uniref:Uncharacterized protein n=1 Tax=Saccharothrix longispora TaxID=33920 RepID=A0ABU1PPU6_9PSEU|nr:hypothetical protein [Saccharothrix longispora]MDR6592601.1 hypothetical protein [Saccharothrix longispora]
MTRSAGVVVPGPAPLPAGPVMWPGAVFDMRQEPMGQLGLGAGVDGPVNRWCGGFPH